MRHFDSVIVKLPPNIKIYEGIVGAYILEIGEVLIGGGWQAYIKMPSNMKMLPEEWFMPKAIIIK